MPYLPRVGDNIILDDSNLGVDEEGGEEIKLLVESFYAQEEKGSKWTYWANCSVQS